MVALYRRGVGDCRRCGDDELRRRHDGRREADPCVLNVSVAASCAGLQLPPRIVAVQLQHGMLHCKTRRGIALVVRFVGVNHAATSALLLQRGFRCCMTLFVQLSLQRARYDMGG